MANRRRSGRRRAGFSACPLLRATEHEPRFGSTATRNPYGPSAAAREAVVAAISEANLYPNAAYSTLTKLIAQREGLTTDHVVVGAGSQEVLRMTAMAYGLAGGKS